MTLAGGVDGGGTQTRCLAIDEHGNIMGIGVSGPSKPDAADPETGRAHLHQAILSASQHCGGPQALDTLFVGMGGVVSQADRQVVHHMLDGLSLKPGIPIGIDHDIRIALAGGTAGQPGIALIVGTGSSCYGFNAVGESWRCGGWGYILDDIGSAFYLGQQALMAVVRAYDGRGAHTALTEPIMDALGIHDINEVMHRIYYPRLDHAGIAALAPLVTANADSDPIAHAIIAQGCSALADMVKTTAHRLALPDDTPIIPVGSLATESRTFRQVLDQAIRRELPQAAIVPPIAPPVVGAAFLALQQKGFSLNVQTLSRLNDALVGLV